jgi:hypothetical protein
VILAIIFARAFRRSLDSRIRTTGRMVNMDG